MRTAAVFLTFLSAASAGLALFGAGSTSVSITENLKVPGESPLELCPQDHESDILTIKSVDLSPNPPKAGVTLVIKAVGTLSQPIEQGAYVNLSVKYGLIRLITTRADLCEQIKNVDLECPMEKGLISIVKSVEMPNEIPPGKYTVLADVFTADGDPVTCLTATVLFTPSNTVKVLLGDL